MMHKFLVFINWPVKDIFTGRNASFVEGIWLWIGRFIKKPYSRKMASILVKKLKNDHPG